jgi:hypothetical protein
MSPFVSLLVVVVVLYGIDCFMALPAGSTVFRSELGARFRVLTAQQAGFRVRGERYLMRTPLLPWGRLVVTALPPFDLGPAGLRPAPAYALPPSPPPAPVDSRPVATLGQPLREGAHLRLQGQTLGLTSPVQAEHLTRLLGRLRRATPERQQRWLARTLPEPALAERSTLRLRLFVLHSLELRVASTLFTLLVFGTLGLWSLKIFPLRLLTTGILYGGLLLAVQVFHWQLHRRYFPAQRGQRWLRTLLMLVSPAEAMTAPHALGRELVAGAHPLRVAAELLDQDAYAALAAAHLRAAHADASPSSATYESLCQMVRARGLDPELLRQPPPVVTQAPAHCPRCLETYSSEVATCAGCPGVALIQRGKRPPRA